MKKLTLYIMCAVAIMLGACDNYDSWTTDGGALLTFDSDTVRFDTLISTISSSTQRLMIFNDNSKGLRITNVSLKHGSDSHFRVNLDGEYLSGGFGSDFEVRTSDSIFCFVEVCLPEMNRDEITHYTDSLCFQLESGKVQYVTLLADGQDAIHWKGIHTISQNETIKSQRPIVIYDKLQVNDGVTLTIAAGTTLMFHHDAWMNVDGTLIVNGTPDSLVTFRGDRTGNLFSYLPYDNTPEQWGGVYLRGTGHKHQINCLDMHASSVGLMCYDTELTLSNSILYNSSANILTTRNSTLTCYNTQLSNAYGDLYKMIGGTTEMLFCTLAQYYNYDSSRGYALNLTDTIKSGGDVMLWPVQKAYFQNCAITGYADDVISGTFLREQQNPELKTDLLFHRCYLKTVNTEATDDRFTNNLFETSDLAVKGSDQWVLFDDYARRYNFTPVVTSLMCDSADKAVIEAYPLLKLDVDRLGHSRLADGLPDIGCYENQKQ